MENQLIDLQSRLAFQEAAIDELNSSVSRQQREIESLRQDLRQMAELLRELKTGLADAEGPEPPPPHY